MDREAHDDEEHEEEEEDDEEDEESPLSGAGDGDGAVETGSRMGSEGADAEIGEGTEARIKGGIEADAPPSSPAAAAYSVSTLASSVAPLGALGAGRPCPGPRVEREEREREIRPPTDRELGWTILQQSLPGFQVPTAEAVVQNWAAIEAYLAEIGADPQDVVEGRVEVGRPRSRERRDMSVHPTAVESIDPHTLTTRLGRRGRHYQDLWEEEAFISRTQQGAIFTPLQDWADLLPGYRDNHDGAYIEHMHANLRPTWSWAVRAKEVKTKRSGGGNLDGSSGGGHGSRCFGDLARPEDDVQGMDIVPPPCPVAMHHPAAWGLHNRDIASFLWAQPHALDRDSRAIAGGHSPTAETGIGKPGAIRSTSPSRTASPREAPAHARGQSTLSADVYQCLHPAAFTSMGPLGPAPPSPQKLRTRRGGAAGWEGMEDGVVPASAAVEDSDELSLLYEKGALLSLNFSLFCSIEWFSPP